MRRNYWFSFLTIQPFGSSTDIVGEGSSCTGVMVFGRAFCSCDVDWLSISSNSAPARLIRVLVQPLYCT